MTDLKDFLTGDGASEAEQEAYSEKLKQVNRELVDVLPKLRDQFSSIKDGNPIELETRQVNIAIPATYWETYDKVIKIYKLRDDFNIRDPEDIADQVQDNVAKVYKEKTTLTLAEVLISQFMLDTVIGFAIHVARSQMMEKVQAAIESGDPDALIRLLKSLQQGEALNEPDDSDDDPET